MIDKDFVIEQTSEYDKLVPFFIENELEFTEEDAITTPTDVIKCWKAAECGSGRLIGGFVLAMRDGEYICDGIAVDRDYRNMKLGEKLLHIGIDEMIREGGSRMYLVARAPEFFRKNGFVTVSRDEAPDFFECLTCPQYGASCHPEVMVLRLEDKKQ